MAATLRSLGLTPPPGVSGEAPVRALTTDSREVREGHLFFALKGRLDGAEFAPFALRQGALAAVCSPEGAQTVRRLWDRPEPPAERLPLIVVEDPRAALARAAAAFYGAQAEVMAAVTGTNGKTSVASFARQIWQALGFRAVNIGTIGVEGAVTAPTAHTTPDPVALHALLADLAAAGVTHAALEASSHGLAQRRLDGVRLAAAALTNVARDHLDYHDGPEDYLAAKLSLFARVLPRGAVAALNADDPSFARALAVVEARGQRAIPVGRDEGALLRLLGQEFFASGQRLRFHWAGDAAAEHVVDLALIGDFQGRNALMAAALVIGCGAQADEVFSVLPGLRGVRGRMEHVATRANGAAIYVDYAHTPDGLRAALAALRAHAPGRLIVVFGAGGERDAGKRPLMGRAACEGADVVIVTDDNPRGEDPAAIRAAVREGCPRAEEIAGRGEAILAAVDMLGPEDRLLIAGKGHETGQIVGDRVLDFDDAERARAAVAVLDGREAEA